MDSNTARALTAEITAAFVSHNQVRPGDLISLIESIHGAIVGLDDPIPPPEPERRPPAVPIKKSVTPDYLVSLEDGRHYQSLKRHLTGLGLTPAQYREKWGLPLGYPMVAPSYSAKRSELAKALGFGRKRIEPPKPVRSRQRKAAAPKTPQP